MRLLADECCPKAIVDRLRADGHDVLYAAETHHRAADETLLDLANAEGRFIVTEDFDFGDMLIRDQTPALGAIILYLPRLAPEERANRLAEVISLPAFDPTDALTVIEAKRFRQRMLGQP